jgi:hypothetical protein
MTQYPASYETLWNNQEWLLTVVRWASWKRGERTDAKTSA